MELISNLFPKSKFLFWGSSTSFVKLYFLDKGEQVLPRHETYYSFSRKSLDCFDSCILPIYV